MNPSRIGRRRFVLVAGLAASQAARVPGANDRIAVAVIGCGNRGLLDEAPQFGPEANVEPVAVCDTWRQQRERPPPR